MLPKKSESQEVLDSIRLAVVEGKTDLHISVLMKLPLQEIYRIRRDILKISLYGAKRKCLKCGHNKSVVCFSKESEHPDWCIICRKKYGQERGSGRPFGKKPVQICKDKKTIEVPCLRCDKVFKSKVFTNHNGREDHWRLCPKCHTIIVSMEATSI